MSSVTDAMRELSPEWESLSEQNCEALLEWSRAVNSHRSKKAQAAAKRRYVAVNRKFARLSSQLIAGLFGAKRPLP